MSTKIEYASVLEREHCWKHLFSKWLRPGKSAKTLTPVQSEAIASRTRDAPGYGSVESESFGSGVSKRLDSVETRLCRTLTATIGYEMQETRAVLKRPVSDAASDQLKANGNTDAASARHVRPSVDRRVRANHRSPSAFLHWRPARRHRHVGRRRLVGPSACRERKRLVDRSTNQRINRFFNDRKAANLQNEISQTNPFAAVAGQNP